MKKKLFFGALILGLVSCSCECSRFGHNIGDVTEFKLYNTRVLILDTLYKNDKPYYKVKTDEGEITEVPEVELENRNY